jgi:hypothetical protein
MNPIKLIAALLVIGGILGLAYGSFSYKETHTVAQVGPLQLNARETHTVNVPVWAGFGAIVVGGLLFAFSGRNS